MRIKDFLVDSTAVNGLNAAGDFGQPVGFVDLELWPDDTRLDTLPPFPLIGLGEPSHPLASKLDAVIEAPVSGEALIRQVTSAPRAAALAVQTLRSLEGLPIERALRLESMCYGLLQGSAEHAEWLAARTAPKTGAAPGDLEIERDGSTLQLLINRPWARNAIDCSIRDRLCEALSIATFDPEVTSITLRSVGATFSVGADLDEFGTTRDPATAHLIRMRTLPAFSLAGLGGILQVHVQGACVGSGLEMAAFAGSVTASQTAWFQLPELAMGLIPGAGGCVSVPRRIGRQRAALMILSGRRINAETALRWGLIDAIQDI